MTQRHPALGPLLLVGAYSRATQDCVASANPHIERGHTMKESISMQGVPGQKSGRWSPTPGRSLCSPSE